MTKMNKIKKGVGTTIKAVSKKTTIALSSTTFLLFTILFCGCEITGPEKIGIRQEAGIGRPLVFHKVTDSLGTGHPTSLTRSSFYIGGETFEVSKKFKIDGFVGPAIEAVDGNKEYGIGLDILPRIRYTYWTGIEPYFVMALGFHYFSDNLGEQATNWGFVLGAGPGVRIKIKDDTWFFVEWRTFHESNGSGIFGSPRPNPGYNADLLNIGIEYKF